MNMKQRHFAFVISGLIELAVGIPAYFLAPMPTMLGFFSALFLAISLVIFVKLKLGTSLISEAKPGSELEAFWKGRFANLYYITLSKHKSLGSAIVGDNLLLVPILLYAYMTKNPVYSCVFMGFAAGATVVILVDYLYRGISDELS